MDTTSLPSAQQPTAPADDSRKPYESPEITPFGDITELTGEAAQSVDY